MKRQEKLEVPYSWSPSLKILGKARHLWKYWQLVQEEL
jgi:hypothetical protein